MDKPMIVQNFQNIDMSSMPEIGIDDTPYFFNNIAVPRVTHILQEMLHEDSLMSWSNYIGLYKHQKYKTVLEMAAEIGTYTHEAIEKYIKIGHELVPEDIPERYRAPVVSAFNAFKDWWKYIKDHKLMILKQEESLVCEYYGGTLDLLIKIDDKIYLVDFKTSNHVGYKYYLQLAAYRRILALYHNIHIDGCIILQLSKTNKSFTEYMIDLHKYEDALFMYQCDETFMSLVKSYYYRHLVMKNSKSFL